MIFTTPTKPQDVQASKAENVVTPRRVDVKTLDYDPLIRELVAGMGERRHRVLRAVAAAPAPAPVQQSTAAPAGRRWLGGALLALGGAAAVLLATAGGTATGRIPRTNRPTGGVSAGPVDLTAGGPTWI